MGERRGRKLVDFILKGNDGFIWFMNVWSCCFWWKFYSIMNFLLEFSEGEIFDAWKWNWIRSIPAITTAVIPFTHPEFSSTSRVRCPFSHGISSNVCNFYPYLLPSLVFVTYQFQPDFSPSLKWEGSSATSCEIITE